MPLHLALATLQFTSLCGPCRHLSGVYSLDGVPGHACPQIVGEPVPVELLNVRVDAEPQRLEALELVHEGTRRDFALAAAVQAGNHSVRGQRKDKVTCRWLLTGNCLAWVDERLWYTPTGPSPPL